MRRPARRWWALTGVIGVLAVALTAVAVFVVLDRSSGSPAAIGPAGATTPRRAARSANGAPSTTATTAPSTTTSVPAPAAGLVAVDTAAVSTDPIVQQVSLAFETYFGGIDTADYHQAFSVLAASYESPESYQAFAAAVATSSDADVTITAIVQGAAGTATADVDFESHQAPSSGPVAGQTCTDWTLAYSLVGGPALPVPGGQVLDYLIGAATPIGPGHVACPGQPS